MPTQPYKTNDGKRVPGVTTVLSGNLGWDTQMLIAWARKTALAGVDPNVVRDQAADTGTLAHYIVECYVKGHELDIEKHYSPEQKQQAMNCALGFKAWKQKYKPEFIDSELSIVHEELGFGGTLDLVSKVDNKLVINDIKTNNHVSEKMIIQVSAYKKLLEYHYKQPVEWCEIIQLSKDSPKFKLYRFDSDTLELGWQAFEMLLKLHKMKNKFELNLTDEGIPTND